LYVPLGLLIGAAVGEVAARATNEAPDAEGIAAAPGSRRVRHASVYLFGSAAIMAVWFGWKDATVVEPANVLVTPSDERAMSWIARETPPKAVFLVGCVEAFADTVCAGDDAGWWIRLLAGRQSTVPPITYGLEHSLDPDLVRDTNHLADLWRADIDAPGTRQALRRAGVTHAYAGVTGKALPRERMAASPWWRVLYDVDGAIVYQRLDEPRASSGS
jgi:hypothetical protein